MFLTAGPSLQPTLSSLNNLLHPISADHRHTGVESSTGTPNANIPTVMVGALGAHPPLHAEKFNWLDHAKVTTATRCTTAILCPEDSISQPSSPSSVSSILSARSYSMFLELRWES